MENIIMLILGVLISFATAISPFQAVGQSPVTQDWNNLCNPL